MLLLESEDLEPFEEKFGPQTKIPEHRHPFNEVRMILEGELIFNIAGNQLLLRAGDRIEIPANTRHSYEVRGRDDCVCICGYRPF
jgi:quercetin dioxygenase-like cupin family protein